MAKNLDSYAVAAERETTAEQIALQRVDEATATARPANIGQTWVEQEYDELEAEQQPLWAASGVEESRSSTVEAAGLAPAADAAERILASHEPVVEAAAKRLADTTEALAPFRRRGAGTKLFHYAAKSGFLLGDVAGISTAAIWGGEIPAIAIVMSISAAVATVTAGLTGTEVRDLRSSVRRQRDVESLTEKQVPFQHLFNGADSGSRYVKGMIGVSVTVGLLVGSAIFALRYSIQGPLVGLVYGGIGVAIAAASFIESYMYADEIADKIDNAEHDFVKTAKRHTRFGGSEWLRRHEQKSAEATSITAEHTERGKAAQDRVRSLKWGILRRNPGVAGHGPAAVPSTVGRTARKGGGSR